MKTEVVVDLVEASIIVATNVKMRPQHKNKHVAEVHVLFDDENSRVQFRVVLFDTADAARDYVAAQESPMVGIALNG